MLAMLRTRMLTAFHKSEEEALDTPITLALWDSAAVMESEGCVELWTQHDDDFLEFARRMASQTDLLNEIFDSSDHDNQGIPTDVQQQQFQNRH